MRDFCRIGISLADGLTVVEVIADTSSVVRGIDVRILDDSAVPPLGLLRCALPSRDAAIVRWGHHTILLLRLSHPLLPRVLLL